MLPVLFQIRLKLCLGSFDDKVARGRDRCIKILNDLGSKSLIIDK